MRANLTEVGPSGLIYSLGLLLGLLGIFFSPFVLSLGTAFMLISLLISYRDIKAVSWQVWIIYLFPVLLVLTDLFRYTDPTTVNQKLLLAFGFTCMGIASIVQSKRITSIKPMLFVAVLAVVLIIDIVSVWNYLANKEEIDQLLLQSKSIEIFGGLHHIHFGIINAICICILCFHILIEKKWRTFLSITAAIVLVICFHILSSRTGLVAFYSSVLVVLGLYTVKEKAYKQGIIGLIVVVAVNIAAYNLSSSFRSKLANSVEDVESWDSPEAVNYKSMGMRLEAYKICLEMIKDKPLFGFGASKAMPQMQVYYESTNSALYKENRIGPHNQFLEYGIKYGALGMLFLLIFFLYWLKASLKPLNYFVLLLVLLLAVSMQFESLLERQVSIYLTAVVFPLIKGKELGEY
ncbi:MAG: O-antigen ligase family protein [Bacteroidia bacterium]